MRSSRRQSVSELETRTEWRRPRHAMRRDVEQQQRLKQQAALKPEREFVYRSVSQSRCRCRPSDGVSFCVKRTLPYPNAQYAIKCVFFVASVDISVGFG